MQELSLNILDVAQNSIRADATLVEIEISQDTQQNKMQIVIQDDGCGMSPEMVQQVENPFFTTRTTRSVGLGVPFFKMSAEMTGGSFQIESTLKVGTRVTANYVLDHIDLMPLGDMASTMTTLIGLNPTVEFLYTYRYNGQEFTLDTRQIKEILGGVAIESPEVIAFIKGFIEENTNQVMQNNQ